ncbi:neuron navigator 3-like [Uloborus diversus]|uniref:neuron navigator 3-like n=1 Tax=Uloborus diversus TaxID=327109 RepID=UPI002409671E|nr:neuron navigator 3-like [Uloborus diversus]
MACLRRGGKNDGSTESLAFNATKRKSIIQIYTDWANHYLDRGRYKRNIQDLQVDVCDGVLLADVIEAVIGTKVPGVVRKPKNPSQMVENITSCLSYIGELGVSIEGVTSKDVREGNLKVILSLFFNLSRYKQAQKNSSSSSHTVSRFGNNSGRPMVASSIGNDMLSKLPSPFRPSSGRSIPCPSTKESGISIPSTSNPSSTAFASRKNKMMAPSTGQQGYVGLGSKGPPSVASSRSGSPHTGSSPSPASFIPQPKSSVATRTGLDKSRSRPSSTSSTSSIPHLPGKASLATSNSNIRSNGGPKSIPTSGSNYGSNSMLDKFKLFNPKDKSAERTKGSATNNKRTSSSSGFSSARSERSDSSTSLCGDAKTPPDPTPSPTSRPPQLGSTVLPKSQQQVKKTALGLPAKQVVHKTKGPDGKDPISSKLEQLKATSKIAKERNNEKAAKALEKQLAAENEKKNDVTENGLKFQPLKLTPNHSVSNSETTRKEEVLCAQIAPDNPVRQSKIVANLTEKSSNVGNNTHSDSVTVDCVPNGHCQQFNSISSSTSMESSLQRPGHRVAK